MSNRYKEELPADITEKEMRNDMLANQTTTKATFFIGGGIAVAFNKSVLLAATSVSGALVYAVALFIGGFLLCGFIKLLVIILRHLEVHPAVIYLTAALGPIAISFLTLLIRE